MNEPSKIRKPILRVIDLAYTKFLPEFGMFSEVRSVVDARIAAEMIQNTVQRLWCASEIAKAKRGEY